MKKNNIKNFFPISSQTSDIDKLFFLKTIKLINSTIKNYKYLEIGSFLGGSLTPFIMDKKCTKILSIDERNKKILKLIEKPNTPYNNLMGTGNIIFNSKIFNYINKTPTNSIRNEKELPDLIQSAINDGKIGYYFKLSSTYINVNTLQDITLIKKAW